MLKALLLLLLLANAGLVAVLAGAADGLLPGDAAQREPERLRRQIRPEAVQTTPAGPAGGASGVAAPGPGMVSSPDGAAPPDRPALPASGASAALANGQLASGTGPAGQPALAGASAATQAAGPLSCWQAGPYDAAQLAQAGRVLRAAGLADGLWQGVPLPPTRSWLLAMGPYGDRTALARKEAELRRRNVEFKPLTAGPELPPGVAPGLALGRYDSEAAADAALDQLNARGVRSARVVALAPVSGRAWLRVPAADPGQQAVLMQLALPAALRWQACPPAAASAPAAPLDGRR